MRTRGMRPANEVHRRDYENMLLVEREKEHQQPKKFETLGAEVWRSKEDGHFSEHML